MIWDAFMFNDEFDMLECRLTELAPVVDRFVLVEADVTHRNRPKPFHYLQHRDRFDAWRNQIIHIQATRLPAGPDPWEREHAQREWISHALPGARPDDLLLQSDIDEIPNPAIIRDLDPDGGYVALEQAYYAFAVDWEMPVKWYGTVAARVETACQGFQQMRAARNQAPVMPDGGWHLSWLGGPETTLEKLTTSPHLQEEAETRDGILSGAYLDRGETISVFGNTQMIPVDVDDTWPAYIAGPPLSHKLVPAKMSFSEDMYPPDDAQALCDIYAKAAGLDGAVIEVGCWEGRSTCILARACHPATVHAVDTWKGSPNEVLEEWAKHRDVWGIFQANIAQLADGNVTPYKMGWRDFFADWDQPIRFIHIDAEHTREEVVDNIAAVRPLVVPGGVICGHDVRWPPVHEGVMAAFGMVNAACNLWWWQKPAEPEGDS